MQAGAKAYQERKFEEGLQDFKGAVDLARQMQPHDARLATALEHVGNGYLGHDFAAADAAFEEELKVDSELYGPMSVNLSLPLESLANSAMAQKNYDAAEKYYFQVVDLTSRAYGESNDLVAMKLVGATTPFLVQKQFDKAEPYLLRAEHIDEATYGEDSSAVEYPLANLCRMYDQWNRPDRAESCYEHYVRVVEKEFGTNSPKIVPVLTAQAGVLRKLGRASDADAADTRATSLRSATMSSN
jgi:tetratricopeptide (TPR) repeat protein